MRLSRKVSTKTALATALFMVILGLPATAGAITVPWASCVSAMSQTRTVMSDGQAMTSVQSGCTSYTFIGATSFTLSPTGASLVSPDLRTMINNGYTGISLSVVYNNAIAGGFFTQQQAHMLVANVAKTVSHEVEQAAIRASSTSVSSKKARSPEAAKVRRVLRASSNISRQLVSTFTTKSKVPQSIVAHTIKPGTILASPCVALKNVNGGAGGGETCDVITMVQENGPNDQNWYLGDELTTSGSESNWDTNLESLTGNDKYANGNQIVKWDPSSSRTQGSCSSISENLTYDGVGVSSTDSVCPNKISPEWYAPTTGSGVTWSGCDGTDILGAPGVDVLHSPPGTSLKMVVRIKMSWGIC